MPAVPFSRGPLHVLQHRAAKIGASAEIEQSESGNWCGGVAGGPDNSCISRATAAQACKDYDELTAAIKS
jgi:hypothetical protein